MNLTVGAGFGRRTEISAVNYLIVRDRLGNPIALFLEQGDGTIYARTAADGDFASSLQALGIASPAVLSTTIKPP